MVELTIIEPGPYFAEGSYGFSETGLRLPFESHFSVEASPSHLLLEGVAQQDRGAPAYRFQVQLLRDNGSQSQADARVSVATIPELTGRMSLRGPTLELLANDLAHNNQISARLVPMDKPRTYEVSGCLALGGKAWFPFHFRFSPTHAEATLANVVAIRKRAR
jgi:hypothetical protein